MIFIINF